jgi:hypothetical protein
VGDSTGSGEVPERKSHRSLIDLVEYSVVNTFEACYLVVYITMMGISVELLILRLSRIGGCWFLYKLTHS